MPDEPTADKLKEYLNYFETSKANALWLDFKDVAMAEVCKRLLRAEADVSSLQTAVAKLEAAGVKVANPPVAPPVMPFGNEGIYRKGVLDNPDNDDDWRDYYHRLRDHGMILQSELLAAVWAGSEVVQQYEVKDLDRQWVSSNSELPLPLVYRPIQKHLELSVEVWSDARAEVAFVVNGSKIVFRAHVTESHRFGCNFLAVGEAVVNYIHELNPDLTVQAQRASAKLPHLSQFRIKAVSAGEYKMKPLPPAAIPHEII